MNLGAILKGGIFSLDMSVNESTVCDLEKLQEWVLVLHFPIRKSDLLICLQMFVSNVLEHSYTNVVIS